MVNHVRKIGHVTKKSNTTVQRSEQELDDQQTDNPLPWNLSNASEVEAPIIKVQVIEQIDQFAQNTKARGEAQSLARNVNVVLIIAN